MNDAHELIRLEKTSASCGVCERYAQAHSDRPAAVLCCEGACLRGEIARRAADLLCRQLAPAQTVRICLGGAFTKDGGQRNLVRRARHVIAIEGCYLLCASRMMKGVVEGLTPRVVVADKLYDFDRSLFEASALPDQEIDAHAQKVAAMVAASIAELAG